MEVIAIICGIAVGGLGSLLFFFDGEVEDGLVCILIGGLFQLLWFPQVFDKRVETETYITNKHQSYTFEQPVKITKTRTYKPLSSLTDETTYTVEFTKGE